MSEAVSFIATAGVAGVFAPTNNPLPFFATAGIGRGFLTTTNPRSFLAIAGISRGFVSTPGLSTLFGTAGRPQQFFVTPSPSTDKQLVLQLNPEISVATDCTSVTVKDATPTYDPATDENPTGYNPESEPTNPLRAKRSEVDLWVCFRVWSATGPEIYYPSSQSGALTPWQYQITMDIPGMYEIILIAAPQGTDYTLWQGLQTLPDYAKNAPGWYTTSLGTVATDCGLINCIIKKRRDYLNGIKCGAGCDAAYQDFDGQYNAMLAALSLLKFEEALVQFRKMEAECDNIGCPCGCK